MKTYAETKREEFMKYVYDVKKLGYRVFLRDGIEYNYGYITDGTNVCYFQLGEYGEGISFSSQVKRGTRFCMNLSNDPNECPRIVYEVTEKQIIYAFMAYPYWSRASDRKGIVRYSDFEDFLKYCYERDKLREIL